MKKFLLLLVFSVIPLSLYSQQRPETARKAPAAKVQPAAQPEPPASVPAPRPAEEEDGGVVIDSVRGDGPDDPYTRAAAGYEAQDAQPQDPNALPSSFGSVKGAFTDAGRNILVLEGDDGTLTFVQLVFGRNGVSWKPAGSLYRSRD